MVKEQLKNLPSIDKLLQGVRLKSWENQMVHPVRVCLAQQLVSELRAKVSSGSKCPSLDEIETILIKRFETTLDSRMQRAINATGVLLHTNLGRAPLGRRLLRRMADVLWGYGTVEFDPIRGERGSRTHNIEKMLALLCRAEASVVVNNNAAALFLILREFASRREVVISRGELVQIGGGFRIPDILKESGARLVEVGTTNITSLRDYAKAVNEKTAILLKVHKSNFTVSGHTESPALRDLVDLAKKKKILFVMDLGSGLLNDLGPQELSVSGVVRSRADLVCFSGDKLMGGPQAGIILCSATLGSKLRQSPLYRVLRLGKAEVFMLEETLLGYVKGESPPLWELVEQNGEILRGRSERVASQLREFGMRVSIVEGTSSMGGGAMPGREFPTFLLQLEFPRPEALLKKLRQCRPAVILRSENKRLFVDLRTVFEEEEQELVAAFRGVFTCLS